MERSGHEMKKKKKMDLWPRGIFEVKTIFPLAFRFDL
jgi:hypothetical protein